MKSFYFRVPALLCGAISVVAFLGTISGNARWWPPIFFAFLPACFLIAGGLMLRMKREISRLRRRVAALEQKAGIHPHADNPHDVATHAQ
jgi:hypothetical protein